MLDKEDQNLALVGDELKRVLTSRDIVRLLQIALASSCSECYHTPTREQPCTLQDISRKVAYAIVDGTLHFHSHHMTFCEHDDDLPIIQAARRILHGWKFINL